MIQSSPNKQVRPEFIISGLKDEYKKIYSLELLNKLSLFGEIPFLSGLNPLGPSESDLERLTFEKSLKAKNLSFRDKVNLYPKLLLRK